jgi:nitrate reductase NapAB chaperone NapD
MLAAVESAVKDLPEVLDVVLVFTKRVAVAALAG